MVLEDGRKRFGTDRAGEGFQRHRTGTSLGYRGPLNWGAVPPTPAGSRLG
jgi:hypothetical protein